MLPKVYFDMEVLIHSAEMGHAIPLMRGRMLSILHAIFKVKPNTYAVSIPPPKILRPDGGVLRIFASNQEDLDFLVKELSISSWIRDYVRLSYPSYVPQIYDGEWRAFKRYRIPTLKSDRKQGDEHGQLRRRRMEDLHKKKLDYFIIYSKSTKQKFTLAIQSQEGQAQIEECFPNSYGFASSDNLFYLPYLD